MTHFRLAILVCACAFGCSGTDDADSADTMAPVQAEVQGEPAPSGLPGLDAPPDVAAVPADAQRTSSGLASRRLVAGAGTRSPKATDTVQVQYSGWQTDGTRFDSSVPKGPVKFPLNGVIAGWTEGLQLMVEGEERRFWIPEELAYRGQPGRPSGMLVFDVQLLAILP